MAEFAEFNVGAITVTLSNRRTEVGMAGQRAVSVDVHYKTDDWEVRSAATFTHSTHGGPVVLLLAGGASVLVTDPSQHGDTSLLDEGWLRSYFGGGPSTVTQWRGSVGRGER